MYFAFAFSESFDFNCISIVFWEIFSFRLYFNFAFQRKFYFNLDFNFDFLLVFLYFLSKRNLFQNFKSKIEVNNELKSYKNLFKYLIFLHLLTLSYVTLFDRIHFAFNICISISLFQIQFRLYFNCVLRKNFDFDCISLSPFVKIFISIVFRFR